MKVKVEVVKDVEEPTITIECSEYTDEIKNPALRLSLSTVDEKVGVVSGKAFKSTKVYKIANIA